MSETDESTESTEGEIILVPTSHVSSESGSRVRQKIEEHKPDIVAIELDYSRFERLHDRIQSGEIKKPSTLSMIRQNFGITSIPLILLFLIQKKASSKIGVQISETDMIEGIQGAREEGAPLALIDRDFSLTMDRVMSSLSFLEILQVTITMIGGLLWLQVTSKEKFEKQLPDAAESEEIHQMLEVFEKYLPEVKQTLIDERDLYMARRLQDLKQEGYTVVAVIGAGHGPGVQKHLDSDEKVSGTPRTNLVYNL